MDAALRASGHFPFMSMHDAPYGTVHWPTAEAILDMEARTKEEGSKKLIEGMWERLLGDHMHHGFYKPGSMPLAADHPAAQVRMVEEALKFANITGSLFYSLCLFRI